VVVVLNFTPVPRDRYRIGAPVRGGYRVLLNSDDAGFGGSDYEKRQSVVTEDVAMHQHPQSFVLNLPPLGALVLAPEGRS
jgi:1,4-alpha-glucan branching enzyme